MNRKQRIALFLSALKDASPAHDEASARSLLANILNSVEDAHSGALYDPENWMAHDRMYPPQNDFRRAGAPAGTELFHTQGHRIWFGSNGAIRIEVRKGRDGGRVELDKPGADGERCPKSD